MFDNVELVTLLMVIEEGSFDAAAQVLHVTPGAISQRIKSLEERVGQVLIRRTTPPEATEAGKIMLHLAQQTRLLNTDTVSTLQRSGHTMDTRVTVAINDGSLATWFLSAIAPFLKEHRVTLDLRTVDHAQTTQLLRDGTAIAALTSDPKPVQGCRAELIGHMQFIAVAAPAFRDKYFQEGLTVAALDAAPIVLCDREDTWTTRFIATIAHSSVKPPIHYVPSSRGAVEAVMLELGWRAAPEDLVRDALKAGDLIDLAPGTALTMDLYWHSFRLKSATLDNLNASIRLGAAAYR